MCGSGGLGFPKVWFAGLVPAWWRRDLLCFSDRRVLLRVRLICGSWFGGYRDGSTRR